MRNGHDGAGGPGAAVAPPRGGVSPQINREFGAPPLFKPEQGETVVAPLGSGPGWWAGAPGALWTGDRFYLVYRLRRPQPERGGETRIAVSDDGVRFETIWTGRKEQFDTPSIERSALVQADTGRWRLYISYVDGADGRWRIDLLEADAPDAFRPEERAPVLTAASIGAEGVKDPWVCRLGGQWQLIASYAPTPNVAVTADQLHGTRDVYNTGLSKSLTGLATSADGRHWRWEGPIFAPRETGWDSYAARINTVVWQAPVFVGLYDGSASVAENYEERCGAAYSFDLRRWQRASTAGPIVGAARPGSGSVRYVEAVQGPGWVRYYYEWTRPDGAHELRTSLVEC